MEDKKSTAAPENQPPETLWTIEDVARYAHCSLRHVSKLREQGLPYRKLGHLVRFSPQAVKRWFED